MFLFQTLTIYLPHFLLAFDIYIFDGKALAPDDIESRCFTLVAFRFRILINAIWENMFKDEPSKICGRQPLKKIEVT